MKTNPLGSGLALAGVMVALTQGCAGRLPRPLALPPRDAPLAHRVAAYREHAAMPHVDFGGWAMRVGEGPVRDLDVARSVLANAPAAEGILHARDNQIALGWGFLGVGAALMLSSLVVLPFSLGSSRDRASDSVLPLALISVGAAVTVPGSFLLGAAQRRVPPAAEEYNRWLWRELDLPRDPLDAAPPAPTPHPPSAPWTTAR